MDETIIPAYPGWAVVTANKTLAVIAWVIPNGPLYIPQPVTAEGKIRAGLITFNGEAQLQLEDWC